MDGLRTIKVGDILFEVKTGRRRRVKAISTHGLFITFEEWFQNEWILNMNPERMEVLLTQLENIELIPDTEAARLFYVKD